MHPGAPHVGTPGARRAIDRLDARPPHPELVPKTTPPAAPRLRWGLCCQFLDAPIRFRQTTHRYVGSLAPELRGPFLAAIARHNAAALADAVRRCTEIGVGAFRITSQLLPLATHPESGYRLADLEGGDEIVRAFADAGRLAAEHDVRLSFHPDQFIVLNSERDATVASAVRELEHTAEISAILGVENVTVHAGSLAGGTAAALERLRRGIDRLGDDARRRLALENDDRLFSPADLLPLCRELHVPLVYDAHHHRCNPDDLSVADATEAAVATWGDREPWAHLSSPRDGWDAPNPRPHADYVDPADFPESWRARRLTIDVEAKAKERAVLAIRDAVVGGAARLPAARRPVSFDG